MVFVASDESGFDWVCITLLPEIMPTNENIFGICLSSISLKQVHLICPFGFRNLKTLSCWFNVYVVYVVITSNSSNDSFSDAFLLEENFLHMCTWHLLATGSVLLKLTFKGSFFLINHITFESVYKILQLLRKVWFYCRWSSLDNNLFFYQQNGLVGYLRVGGRFFIYILLPLMLGGVLGGNG